MCGAQVQQQQAMPSRLPGQPAPPGMSAQSAPPGWAAPQPPAGSAPSHSFAGNAQSLAGPAYPNANAGAGPAPPHQDPAVRSKLPTQLPGQPTQPPRHRVSHRQRLRGQALRGRPEGQRLRQRQLRRLRLRLQLRCTSSGTARPGGPTRSTRILEAPHATSGTVCRSILAARAKMFAGAAFAASRATDPTFAGAAPRVARAGQRNQTACKSKLEQTSCDA